MTTECESTAGPGPDIDFRCEKRELDKCLASDFVYKLYFVHGGAILYLKSIFVSGDQHEHVARGHRPAHKRCPDIWRHGARHLSHTGRGQ